MGRGDGASRDGKQLPSDQVSCAVACAAIASRSFELCRAIAVPMAAPVGRTVPFEHGSFGALDPPPPRGRLFLNNDLKSRRSS